MSLDREFMQHAITAARHCNPPNPAQTPRVGAVLVHTGEVLAEGHRGASDHAEYMAFSQVQDSSRLIGATLFTTLEPCTGSVRRDPSIACTNLILQHQLRKVFVGILDPNQGVCGKGVIALQEHNVEVSLFDPDLAREITALNVEFIRAQRSLGVEITYPADGARIATYDNNGNHTFKCRTRNPPGNDISVVVARGGRWWPQAGRLTRKGSTDEYDFNVHFGSYGEHVIHIVKVSDLGAALFEYYRTVAGANIDRRRRIRERHPDIEDRIFWGDYTGIPMATPPRGLDIQATVSVNVEEPPTPINS